MLQVTILKTGGKFANTIAQKNFSNIKRFYNYIRKYFNRYKYNIAYRVHIFSENPEGIKFIIDSFMPREYAEGKYTNIKDICLETTLDLVPVIAEVNCSEYHYYDFHIDCIDLYQGDIIYSFKDSKYFLVFKDPNELATGCAIKDANDCDSNYMLSRMDTRKASEKEIKLYGLDRLKEIYTTSTTYDELNSHLSKLRQEYPRLV